MCSLKVFLPLLLGLAVSAAPAEDLVTDLPGLNFAVTYNQYSGYLNGTEGRKLHYWLTESKSNPAVDPLILWLNGGPGCSSLMGLLTELGPFRVNDDGSGTLVSNDYSWNDAANVVFLESPACVGFSYDENDKCGTGDIEVADMNYLALQHFFLKFPEYNGRPFYITGESYGGIYVPTLSVKVVEGQATFPVNFIGYAIGNGLLSYDNNDNSLIFYGYYHSLFGEELWTELVQNCCVNATENQESCSFVEPMTANCRTPVNTANDIIYNGGLNVYNLYGDCLQGTRKLYEFDLKNLFRKNQIKNRPQTKSDPPCTDNSLERAYLNSPEVRAALHIPDTVQDWDVCSDLVGVLYSRDYDTTVPQISQLREAGLKGLIYNGDVDMACNVIGNEWDLNTLGLPNLENRRTWTVNNQVAGFVDAYENLDFVTFRGSGHMVPDDKPEEALHMLTCFLNNQPY